MSERLSGLQLSNCIVDAEALIRANEHAYVDLDALQSARVQISMANELRERRAADLTGDDLSVLSDLRVRVRANLDEFSEPLQSMHLAVLDRLLAGRDGK